MLNHPPGRLKIAGTYRVSQPIENFKLRVRIVQQKSLLAELFETEDETRDGNFLEIEEREFSWQKKIFSPWEKIFYREEKNCITEAQKNYHRRLVDENENHDNDVEKRLFTYIQNDSYCPENFPLVGCNRRSSLSSRNENALPIVNNRKPFAKRYNKKVIDEKPSLTRILTNHYLYKDRTTMYVMADLSSKNDKFDSTRDREVLLCTIIHDRGSETLTINPDFTNDDCYTVEATGMGYDYWIEHASPQRNIDESDKQRDDIRHKSRDNESSDDANTSNAMILPPSRILRIFLTLEIVCARDFAYDALFVTYLIDLRNNWSTSDNERLTGRTQRCRMVRGTANFTYIGEITLDFDLKSLNNENVQPSWPYLLFSVGSLDNWTRYRIEGYASMPVPSSPGYRSFELHTWRPVSGFVNSLRRFFTGGTSELEDITYCGIPGDHDDSRLEKTRLRVVPAGTITINLMISHQCKMFMKKRGMQRDAIDRLSAGTLVNSVDNVLEQFKAARERMIQARAMNF